jgi:pSer/pThr/pTyr-binding forkhead associated (FHA) protein
MSQDENPKDAKATVLDRQLAPDRLKEGLVPRDTTIFLRVEQGPAAKKLYSLSDGGVYTIGRQGADIPLDDDKVSRKHAEIGLYGPGAYVIRDLASTNGTWVNGRRMGEKTKLEHWDLIQVGETHLRFTIHDKTIPLS